MTRMTVARYQANIKWLKQREEQYPFRCRTKIASPQPHRVTERLKPIDFISAPLMREAEWGFKTEADMARFKEVYVTLDNKS